MSNKWFYIHTFNLIVIYTVGIVGIVFTDDTQQKAFLQLTSLNLIVTTLFTLLTHERWNGKFIASIILIFLSGFFIEVMGVKTGMIFGNYHYGATLGMKLLDVPLVIGVNWFLLIYIITASFHKIKNGFVFGLVSAVVMTLLDILIEPVAIKLDFWQWQNNNIPLQNYAAWFLISFVLFLFFRKINGVFSNRFAIVVLIIQFIFFALLNLWL